MNVDALLAEIRLAWLEWKSLLSHSIRYQRDVTKQAFDDSVLETISQIVKKLWKQGKQTRVKLSRILFRMLAAALNQNRAAFKMAFRDLVELGKTVA